MGDMSKRLHLSCPRCNTFVPAGAGHSCVEYGPSEPLTYPREWKARAEKAEAKVAALEAALNTERLHFDAAQRACANAREREAALEARLSDMAADRDETRDRCAEVTGRLVALEARLATTSRCSTPDCPNDAVIGLCGDHALAMTDLEKREAKVGEYEDEILRLEARLAEVGPVVEAAESVVPMLIVYEADESGPRAVRLSYGGLQAENRLWERLHTYAALRSARAKREKGGAA